MPEESFQSGLPHVVATGVVKVDVDRDDFDRLREDVDSFVADAGSRIGGGLAGSNQSDRPIHEIRESLLDLRVQVAQLNENLRELIEVMRQQGER